MDRRAWWPPWCHEESDVTERLTHTHTHTDAGTHTQTCTHIHVLGAFLAFTGVADTFSKRDFFLSRRGVLVLADSRIATFYHHS